MHCNYSVGIFEVLVDQNDLFLVHQFDWRVVLRRQVPYVETWAIKPNGKYGSIGMHRMIMGTTDPKLRVDHINGNGLDNRRENLRECSNSQNGRNRGPQRNNQTGFKGVCMSGKRFRAFITIEGKRVSLGTRDTAIEAAQLYDIAALKHYGEFARLNFGL